MHLRVREAAASTLIQHRTSSRDGGKEAHAWRRVCKIYHNRSTKESFVNAQGSCDGYLQVSDACLSFSESQRLGGFANLQPPKKEPIGSSGWILEQVQADQVVIRQGNDTLQLSLGR